MTHPEKQMFYCPYCIKVFSGNHGTILECRICGTPLTETQYSKEYWQTLPPEEKERIKNSWKSQKRRLF